MEVTSDGVAVCDAIAAPEWEGISPGECWAAHVAMRRADDGGVVLSHLLTKEEVTLPALAHGGYDLVEDASDLVLFADGLKYASIPELFKGEVQYDGANKRIRLAHAEDSAYLSPSIFAVISTYMAISVRGVMFKMKLYRTDWTYPSWWWEARLLAGPWDVSPVMFFRNLGSSHIPNWLKWVTNLMPKVNGIRRQPMTKNASYLDCFPESAVSTTALLHICVRKWSVGRPICVRSQMVDVMTSIFATMLQGEDLELLIDWSPQLQYRIGTVPSSASASILIDDCMVHLDGLFSNMSDESLAVFVQTAASIDSTFRVSSKQVSLVTMLLVLFETYPKTIYRQVLGQLARHVDECLPDHVRDNPLDVDAKNVSPQRCRRDVVLGEKLGMGEGCSGDAIVKATNTSQHIKSFLMFQPTSSRAKNLNPQTITDDIALKYIQVQECTWPHVQHLSCGSDGVRVCTKDVVYFLFAGVVKDELKAAWALRVGHSSRQYI